MKINVGHWRDQGIDFLVFDADAPSRTQADRARLLGDLTARANRAGLWASKSALAFTEFGKLKFYGAPDLVRYMASRGLPGWTHTLDV